MRVVGGTDSEGRLEVYYNGNWGTVCSNQFGYAEAVVVCNSLGFGLLLMSLKHNKILKLCFQELSLVLSMQLLKYNA